MVYRRTTTSQNHRCRGRPASARVPRIVEPEDVDQVPHDSLPVGRASRFTEERLDSLYCSEGFGGDRTMRAQVIRELIDEIRTLRREVADSEDSPTAPEV